MWRKENLPLFLLADKMLPFFPQKVSNVTVTIGQDAVLRCKVDNLNNYKVCIMTLQVFLSVYL